MKKTAIFILALFLAEVMLCLLCGCSSEKGVLDIDGHGKRFSIIESTYNYTVYVDTETGVEWLHGDKTFIPIIDSYGNPILFPGFDAREDALPGQKTD